MVQRLRQGLADSRRKLQEDGLPFYETFHHRKLYVVTTAVISEGVYWEGN
jgi:hypothetical protein